MKSPPPPQPCNGGGGDGGGGSNILQRPTAINMYESPVPLRAAVMKGAFRWQRLGGTKKRHSDGGLGEGHSEVVVLAQIVVVELDEGLDGLLD